MECVAVECERGDARRLARVIDIEIGDSDLGIRFRQPPRGAALSATTPTQTTMDGRPGSPSQLPASNIKYHHPYFSPSEVEYLTEKLRGKMPINQEKLRQQACAFIEAVSVRIGL